MLSTERVTFGISKNRFRGTVRSIRSQSIGGMLIEFIDDPRKLENLERITPTRFSMCLTDGTEVRFNAVTKWKSVRFLKKYKLFAPTLEVQRTGKRKLYPSKRPGHQT